MFSDNHNEHWQDGNGDNNGQNDNPVQGGEFRNGRKSPFKNSNPQGHDVPNEYIDDPEERQS